MFNGMLKLMSQFGRNDILQTSSPDQEKTQQQRSCYYVERSYYLVFLYIVCLHRKYFLFWNSLPRSVRFCESLTTFWKHLKTF